MGRFFTILEGEGKGTHKPLTSTLMIVGRSKNADLQIEDALVSRRHLEIRVEADAVFVENKSTHGSYLNGKPLVGVVSLNPGDVLDIGHTKLCYEETSGEALPSGGVEPVEAMSSEIDGTRIAEGDVEIRRQKDKDAAPDATRAVVEDGTRMLNPSELPNWVAQEKRERASPAKGMWIGVLVVVALLALVWFMRGRGHASNVTVEYKDSLYVFNLEHPLDWSKITDNTGVLVFGFGGEGDKEWGRLNIYTDQDAEHALTGLADGFFQYQGILKKRFKDIELSASNATNVNNATVMDYWFSTPTLEGKGFYTLNGDARIVVECVSPRTCYQQYASTFSSILQSFHLGDFEPQQFIDFPKPDEGMRHLALANPAELAHQVDEYAKRGEMLLASKDVKPDNLFESVQEYRKALQLAIAPLQRLPAYHPAAEGLLAATKQLNQALERQRFEINRALKDGDKGTAYWEAHKMMQMVPDKTDPAYQEAYKVVQSLQPPKR